VLTVALLTVVLQCAIELALSHGDPARQQIQNEARTLHRG